MSGQSNWSLKQLFNALQGLMSARAGMVLTLVVMAALILAQSASAETDVSKKKNVKRQKVEQTITTTVTEDDGTDDEESSNTSGSTEEGQLTSKFGSKATTGTAGCKTEAASEEVIRKLKIDCNNWIKEQKKDLGKKYHAGTCEESCDDCGMSLQRCSVTGTIRYAK